MQNRFRLFSPIQLCGLIVLATLLGGCAPPETVELPELVFPQPPDPPRFYFEHEIRSNIDIEGETEDQRMTRFLTGVGRAGRGFGKPFDVAVYQGRIFMSDTANRTVFMMDYPNSTFSEVGKESPVPFSKPMGLDVDAKGNLYVVDNIEKRVVIFDRDGHYLKHIDDPGFFSRPTGIAVNPEGTRIFVVDVGGVSSDQHDLQVFDVQSGKHLYTIGSRGKGDGELNLPKDAVVGKDGLLYVVDSGNFRVSAFKQDGTFVKSFGAIGTQYGSFSRPKGISADPEGNLYVVDAGFGNFQIFNTDGQLLMFIGSRSARGDRAEFMLPAGIDVDENGRIYVVDQFHKKLEVFRPATLGEDQGYLVKKPTEKTEKKP